MTTYKLTYFNLNGKAEPIRWLFKLAGVDFEDERIEPADWPSLKNSGRFPNKQLPLLEIDGTVYTQSIGILHYLARKYGFVADDDILNLRLDQAAGIVFDSGPAFRLFMIERDPQKKEELKKALLEELFPMVLNQLNEIVSSTTGDFIAGSKLTWGDLVLTHAFQNWQKADPNLFSKYPALEKLRDTVLATPAIKAWVEVRPNCFM